MMAVTKFMSTKTATAWAKNPSTTLRDSLKTHFEKKAETQKRKA